MTMTYALLGRTGMTVSRFALGTMMFGAAGNPDHDECIRIIHTALERGINFIDTADMYSAGESESIVAKALRGRRDQVVLATKGHFPLTEGLNTGGNSGASAPSCRRQSDATGHRLHRPLPGASARLGYRFEETLGVLSDLVHAGKIRSFGCSTFPAYEIVESHRIADARGLMRFRTEQPPYNLLARGIERDVLPVAEKWGMGVLTWSPLGFGFLTGRYRRGIEVAEAGRAALRPAWFNPTNPVVTRKLDVVEQLVEVADGLGVPLPSLAMAFPLAHRAVTSVIVGPRTLEQFESTIEHAELDLTTDVLDRLDAIVPPGTDVYEPNPATNLPWITDATRRRRVPQPS